MAQEWRWPTYSITSSASGNNVGRTVRPIAFAVFILIAITLLDDVAEMDSDTKLDASIGRQAGVPLDHAILHLHRHADRSSAKGKSRFAISLSCSRNQGRRPSDIRKLFRSLKPIAS
jgi:hypothetical protein